MGDPDVLVRGLQDAECKVCPVQTTLCLVSRNVSSHFSFEAITILQGL